MSLNQINRRLLSYVPLQSKSRYSLDRMHQLMAYLGNPQNALRVIHVAGTSGKTSTAYYAASFLKEAGYKVGLSVSPHVSKVTERVQINLTTLTDFEFSAVLNEFLDQVNTFEVHPTYFEVLVAFAYWFFYKQGVDYAVIEVGLGGLLDGTNVVNAKDKHCIITDIGFDHTEILGKTIEKIAAQKAGIIHEGNHVRMNYQPETVLSVIRQRCTDVGAHLEVMSTVPDDLKADNVFNSLPSFQRRNSALAYNTVCDAVGHPLEPAQITDALAIVIEGRMETFHYKNRIVIIDGAHNEQKITALVDAVQDRYFGKKIQLVVSFGQNKSGSVDINLELLHKISDSIIFTQFDLGQDVPRLAIDAAELAKRAKGTFDHIAIERRPEIAFQQAMEEGLPVLLIVGSFYLLHHVRPLLSGDEEQKR